MRTFIFLLALSTIVLSAIPSDGNYDNWNWEDQSDDNWQTYNRNEGKWREITPPFTEISEKIGSFVDIYEAGDYTKNKGWKLLWTQFDSEYPYFILVNPHRALVRVFFYIEDKEYSHVLSTLEYHDNINPSSLGLSQEFQLTSIENYTNNALSDGMIFSNIIHISSTNNWCISDFPIVFDPNIKSSVFEDKKWVFRFFGCDKFDISLKSTGEGVVGDEVSLSTPKNTSFIGEFDAGLSKVASKYSTFSKGLKSLEKKTKDINIQSNVVLRGFKKTVEVLSVLSSGLGFLPTVSSTISDICGMFGIISGTADKTTPPMFLSFTMETTGTMNIRQVLGGNTLKIPGVNGDKFPDVTWNPYDCPIGAFTMEEPLTLIKTQSYKRYYIDGIKSVGIYEKSGQTKIKSFSSNVSINEIYLDNNDFSPINKEMYSVVSYKIKSGQLKLAQNNIAGRELLNVKCCLMFRINNYSESLFDLENESYSFNGHLLSGDAIPVPVHNIIYDHISNGYLKIYTYDLDEDLCEIGTPYLDPENLYGLIAEVPEDADVYLKVVASYSSVYAENPLVFQYSFPVHIEEDEKKVKYPTVISHWEQEGYALGDYYQTDFSTVTIDYESNENFEAHKIKMTTGFVGKSGFSAKTKSPYPRNGSLLITNYEYEQNN